MSALHGCVLTVNAGKPRAVSYTDAPAGLTAIDKRPVTGPVRVAFEGRPGSGATGVAGDTVCDLRFHGGADRAVYAFAREDPPSARTRRSTTSG